MAFLLTSVETDEQLEETRRTLSEGKTFAVHQKPPKEKKADTPQKVGGESPKSPRSSPSTSTTFSIPPTFPPPQQKPTSFPQQAPLAPQGKGSNNNFVGWKGKGKGWGDVKGGGRGFGKGQNNNGKGGRGFSK